MVNLKLHGVIAVDEYTPFISKGIIHAPGSNSPIPINILQDTGANQSILLESKLPTAIQTSTGSRVLIQGVELETMSIPFHKVILNCDIVSGPVLVGVWHSLPMKDVDLILGSDLAGERVTAVPCMLSNPEDEPSSAVDPVVYPACAETRTMAKQTQKSQDQNDSTQEATSGNNGMAEVVIGLADTFMGHDLKEVVNIEDNNPSNDCPPQTVESVDLGTIKRKELIELQERQADLSHIQEQVVPEGQAGLSQVGYYKKSGVL